MSYHLTHRAVRALALCALAGAMATIACSGGDGPTGSVPVFGTISGKITRAADGAPVTGARVTTVPSTLAVTTGPDGSYEIGGVPIPAGRIVYLVVVSLDGFASVAAAVALSPDDREGQADLGLIALAPPPSGGPPPGPSPLAVRVTAGADAVECIREGDLIVFEIAVGNTGAAAVEDVSIADTLSGPFARPLEPGDIVIDREVFPAAVATIDASGFSFTVRLGTLAPSGAVPDGLVPAYTVSLPASAHSGVWCSRAVARASEADLAGAVDTGCLATTLVFEIDIGNEDGTIGPGGEFSPEKETFRVGDGGASRPDSLAYRLVVTNRNCFPVDGLRVADRLAPNRGILRLGEILPGRPTRGAVTAEAGGFTWDLGTVEPQESVEILFRAEATAAGEDVNRVELTTTDLPGTLVDEEPITVLP